MSAPDAPPRRRLRITHFCPWAERAEDASAFLLRLPSLDLRGKVASPDDPDLLRMARLDCDWHGENTRAFAAMRHPALEFAAPLVTGTPGLLELARMPASAAEERWLIFDGQNPQKIAPVLGKLLPLLARAGWRILHYAFDEASRTMPCFKDLAPYLRILIHDEFPLDPRARPALPASCRTIHRSWVANVVPFAAPFEDNPEEKILFLGSKLGLTDHRRRQLDRLQNKFGDRCVVIHDHSVSVADRHRLNRYKVGLCPEGRKFDTPAMSATHTDRPFWSGCLGMVVLSEDSRGGGRLEDLARNDLIVRYPHGDLAALVAACERALALPRAYREKTYDYFNHRETVGSVVAAALADERPGAPSPSPAGS